jgi:hypothetical protein
MPSVHIRKLVKLVKGIISVSMVETRIMFRCLLVSFSGLDKVESSSQPFTVLGMNTSDVEAVLQADTFDKHRCNIAERIEYHLKCLEVASYLTFHVCSNPAV